LDKNINVKENADDSLKYTSKEVAFEINEEKK
jgi:hypothetical protein